MYLFFKDEGTVYVEVHTAGVHRQLFGTNAGHDIHVPLPLSLPNKVVIINTVGEVQPHSKYVSLWDVKCVIGKSDLY